MAKDDPRAYKIFDKPLVCPMCGHAEFWHEAARVESGLMTIAPGRDAVTLTCDKCKYIMWFEN